jgi:hypothetical protein
VYECFGIGDSNRVLGQGKEAAPCLRTVWMLREGLLLGGDMRCKRSQHKFGRADSRALSRYPYLHAGARAIR